MASQTSTPLEYSTHQNEMNILGFWLFLGAEIVLFATLFAGYFVLENGVANGPTLKDVLVIKDVLIETFLLLTSSFTMGLALHQMRQNNLKGMLVYTVITLLLGAGFMFMEINEFIHYVHEGVTMQTSAFGSAFFTLLGTHGVHVTLGIGWVILLIIQLVRRGITPVTSRKFFIVSLYWHFLDVIWIFIFTFVYLKGVLM